MTIDEAIGIEKRERIKCENDIRLYKRIVCRKYSRQKEEYHKQLAEWLEELKSYRAHIFSGDMTQVMLKDVYNKAIDDFIHECDRHCGFYNGYNKNLTREDILMIAEQLKAGGENEQRI